MDFIWQACTRMRRILQALRLYLEGSVCRDFTGICLFVYVTSFHARMIQMNLCMYVKEKMFDVCITLQAWKIVTWKAQYVHINIYIYIYIYIYICTRTRACVRHASGMLQLFPEHECATNWVQVISSSTDIHALVWWRAQQKRTSLCRSMLSCRSIHGHQMHGNTDIMLQREETLPDIVTLRGVWKTSSFFLVSIVILSSLQTKVCHLLIRQHCKKSGPSLTTML